jgi:hypothetical protein
VSHQGTTTSQAQSDLGRDGQSAAAGWAYGPYPDGDVEHYDTAIRYQITGDFGQAEVLIGQTIQYA